MRIPFRHVLLPVALVALLTAPAPAADRPTALDRLEPRSDIARDSVLVRLMTGDNAWRRGKGSWQPVRADQMLKEGDEVRTGERGMLVLELPLQAGFVNVLAGSELQVAEMRRLPGFDGPQSGTLTLNGGKAFVRLRKFNRQNSRFRVTAPNGSAVVRGTEFVVGTVAPFGAEVTTVVGVDTGLVQVAANGKTVDVTPGKVSTIVGNGDPSEAKESPAVPITLSRFLPRGDRLSLSGKAAPGASVMVNEQPVTVDAQGRFTAEVSLAPDATQVVIESLELTGHVETLSIATDR